MIDDFVRRALPPRAAWPAIDLGDLAYPETMNAASVLLDDGNVDGGQTAVIGDGETLTYAALRIRSDAIARVLADDGVVSGNRVLLCGPNSPMLIAAWFGILKAGGIVVAVMPLLRSREIAAVVAKAAVSHAIVDAACTDADAATAGLRRLTFGNGNLEARIAAAGPFTAIATRADDPAIIAFTSGTTGVPKGTVHFHRDLLIPADAFARHVLEPARGAVWSATPPLAFTFGLGALVLFPCRFGGTSVTLSDASPAGILAAIERHGIGLLFTAPTAYKAMLAHGVAGHDLTSLTTCVSAGEHLPAPTFAAWHAATGVRLVNGIGSTEMMHIFIAAGPDAPAGSTGRAVPGYTACVLDAGDRPLTVGEGRLAVRGPTGCRNLDDPRQATYVVDGWNVTGDSYRVDADGVFWYLARADDMIVSSGYNIAPPEVEAALCSHPAVAECAVIGVADAARGQVVTAFVVARQPGDAALARALQDHVKAAIAPYKYPRGIRFVHDLPRTATGKIQRHRLREGEP